MLLVEPDDEDGVVDALEAGADALVTFRWDDRFLTPGLAWIQAISAGVEQFPLAELRERGVIVTNAGDVHAPTVALHAFALLLALVRRIGESVRDASTGTWQPRSGTELRGRSLGVLGLGAIGEEVARLGKSFGMSVIGTKRTIKGYDGLADEALPAERTTEVFERSDAVVIALPDTPATRGLIGSEQLSALGEGWLINVGRGCVLDEQALVAALALGQLRGAALDVTSTEPLPSDSPLWSMPSVIVTPHVGAASDAVTPRLARLVEGNLAALSGEVGWTARII
jgi:D-2-hydroxyacid dehydrogenase (NADP+)